MILLGQIVMLKVNGESPVDKFTTSEMSRLLNQIPNSLDKLLKEATYLEFLIMEKAHQLAVSGSPLTKTGISVTANITGRMRLYLNTEKTSQHSQKMKSIV